MMMVGESGRCDGRWQSIGEKGCVYGLWGRCTWWKKMESDATKLAHGVLRGRDGFMVRIEVVG